MALKPYVQAKIGGATLAFTAATSGAGDTLAANGKGALIVLNGGGSAITVTVAVPGLTKYGAAQPDVTSISIAAGAYAVIGPFPNDLKDLTDGFVHVTYSTVTSVTVAAVQV